MRNINPFSLIVLLLLTALIFSACSQTSPTVVFDEQSADSGERDEGEKEEHADEGEDEHKDEDASGSEHAEGDEHEHIDPPSEYDTMTNPFGSDPDTLKSGMLIFETNCASCHGSQGMGDGPAAEALDPKPASLADKDMMDDMTDGYLFWRISEGGMFEPFHSVMPAWKNSLSEDERWQVISYIRTLSKVNGN